MPFTPGKRSLDNLTIDNDDEPFAIGSCGYTPSQYGGCGGWASQSNYGSCGGRVGHVTSIGGCGNSHC